MPLRSRNWAFCVAHTHGGCVLVAGARPELDRGHSRLVVQPVLKGLLLVAGNRSNLVRGSAR